MPTIVTDMQNAESVADLIVRKINNYSPGFLFKLNDGLGTIGVIDTPIRMVPERTRMPGRRADIFANDSQTYRRLKVSLNFPAGLLQPRQKKSFLLSIGNNGYLSAHTYWQKLQQAQQTFIRLTREKLAAEVAAKVAEEESVVLTAKAEERAKIRRQNRDARTDVYEAMMTLVGGMGTVESELKNEFFNLTLPNKFKVKLVTEHDKVTISEIETPLAISPDKLAEVKSFLEKLSTI